MSHNSISMLGNPRLERLVEEEYHRFKDIINEDSPAGVIEEKIKEIALTEYLNDSKLRDLVKEIQEEMSDVSRQKMQDIMYCGISSIIFKDLSISIYNAKKILGVDKAFSLIKKQIQDPLIIGNVILLTISLEMEVR